MKKIANLEVVDFVKKYSRVYVRKFSCPQCGVGPGELCRGKDGRDTRMSNHLQRIQVAAEARDGVRLERYEVDKSLWYAYPLVEVDPSTIPED